MTTNSSITTEYQQQHPPTTCANSQLENIKVAVRLRPFTEKEKQKNNKRIIDIEQNTVVLYSPRYGDVAMKKFTFDYSYWSHDGFKRDSDSVNVPDLEHPNWSNYVGQEKVFEDLGLFLLKNALEGYNSALLAYGQTGSGKSYTVSGYGKNEGILPRFARALFVELDKKAINSKRPTTLERSQSETKHDETNVALEEANDRAATETPNKMMRTDPTSQSTSSTSSSGNNRYEVYFSMIEIYNEVVRDLLAKNDGYLMSQTNIARRGLKVREHPKRGFFVENLTSYPCSDKNDIQQRIEEGQLNKSIVATSMNETSSRGHTIYEFRIKQFKSKGPESPEETLTTSIVQLVDLAGSERMTVHVTDQLGGGFGQGLSAHHGRAEDRLNAIRSRSQRVPNSASSTSSTPLKSSTSLKRQGQNNASALGTNNDTQQRFKESVSINQSLSALGNCIQVLSQYSQQLDSNSKRQPPKIPYRDSVLTKLLNRCCLSGNSKIVIIATLSPADVNYDDTLSTLRFADRAKQIRTHATINRLSRGEVVNALQKENERLRQIVDGRTTRSDDSSQTSNFDDSENMMDNFTGPRSNDIDPVATPSRSHTTTRKSRADTKRSRGPDKGQRTTQSRIASSSSNPALAVEEQMKTLVSSASKKLSKLSKETKNRDKDVSKPIHKSRSLTYGIAQNQQNNANEFAENELNEVTDLNLLDELDLNDIADIEEGLLSPDSDDSFGALTEEGLSNDEKIKLFNKLLSNTSMASKMHRGTKKENRLQRPKKTHREEDGIKKVSVLSSTLKKSNPYLSNLNPDEQLTGMISFIIKQGDTIVGKNSNCDIVLFGPELRGNHAKITRVLTASSGDRNDSIQGYEVFIEPILSSNSDKKPSNIALMVNGASIETKTKLNHCDRLLFGSNTYFVFIDNVNSTKSENGTVADLDLVTYDMARNEVLRKVMNEPKNEAMINEINQYTHRPGTGKHKTIIEEPKETATKHKLSEVRNSIMTKSMAIQDDKEDVQAGDSLQKDETSKQLNQSVEGTVEKVESETKDNTSAPIQGNENNQDADYRERLMEDTYEYALPVAEVNAVAKEMGIKVTYGHKILIGEEQLPEQTNLMDGNYLDSQSSSSLGDGTDSDKHKARPDDRQLNDDRVTQLDKLDSLDIPPELYIHVHLEDFDINFYWTKSKFQARRYKILELYGAWDIGGKSSLVEYLIDQSKIQGDYLIDPFVDDPSSTIVLIGHAQITLQPITHRSDVCDSYDILDLDDETVGSISIEAIPCYTEREKSNGHKQIEPYRSYTSEELAENLIDDPKELLGHKLVFLLKIISCQNIPNKYSHVFCQYTLNRKGSSTRTKILLGDDDEQDAEGKLVFDHSHYIYIDKVNTDILDFLQHGFLTIQVVGQYKLNERTSRSPTVVSTIINSINKYKYRVEHQGAYNANYSSSAYDNSNTDSAKSNRMISSGALNSNSGASSVVSTSATVNLFDQQNDDDDASNSTNGLSQENIIDMILTKRKLDRAENQLHYLKRTINIAEHYNKNHIPVKTVKKLLNSYGHELESGSLEEMAADVMVKGKNPNSKHSGCVIQ